MSASMGDIAIALIALAGVLIPVFWGTRQATRDRQALKDEADLLASIPEDMRTGLRKHIERRLDIYLFESERRPVMRARRKAFVGVMLIVLPSVVSVALGSSGLVPEVWQKPAIAILASTLYLGLLLLIFGARSYARERRRIAFRGE